MLHNLGFYFSNHLNYIQWPSYCHFQWKGETFSELLIGDYSLQPKLRKGQGYFCNSQWGREALALENFDTAGEATTNMLFCMLFRRNTTEGSEPCEHPFSSANLVLGLCHSSSEYSSLIIIGSILATNTNSIWANFIRETSWEYNLNS